MDIEQQAAEAAERGDDGVDVHLHNVDGSLAFYGPNNDKPVIIRVAGAHSTRYKQVENRQRNEKLKPRSFTGNKLFEDGIERAVACTLSWEGLEIGGVAIPFNKKNAEMIYKKASWIYDDVNEAIHDGERFFGNGSKQPVSMPVSGQG